MASVVAFTGTSSGKTYEVGKVYVTGTGQKKIAMADGSFKPVDGSRGVSHTKGSSQASNVTFYVGSGSGSSKTAVKSYDPGLSSSALARRVVDKMNRPTRSPGAAAAMAPYLHGSGASVGGVVSSGQAGQFALPSQVWANPQFKTIVDRVNDLTVTAPVVFGQPLPVNPYMSDADRFTQRYGEGELAETVFFFTVAGSDIAWAAGGPIRHASKVVSDAWTLAGGPNVSFVQQWPKATKDEYDLGVVTPSSWADPYSGPTAFSTGW